MAGNGQVVGNRNSRVYLAPNCPSIGRMKEANRVTFETAKDVDAAGE